MLWGCFHCVFWYPIPLSEYSGSSNNLIQVSFLRERVGIAWASQVALLIKSPPANTGDTREAGSIPGSGRSPGRERGDTLQYSCLENTTDRGAWRAIVHGVTKSGTWLKWLSMHAGIAWIINKVTHEFEYVQCECVCVCVCVCVSRDNCMVKHFGKKKKKRFSENTKFAFKLEGIKSYKKPTEQILNPKCRTTPLPLPGKSDHRDDGRVWDPGVLSLQQACLETATLSHPIIIAVVCFLWGIW